MARFFRGLFPFAIAALVCLGFAWLGREKSTAVAGWPTTEGRLTEVNVVEGDSESAYFVRLAYSYAVEGQRYSGHEREDTDTSMDEAQKRAGGFQVGATVPVYYDPKHPGTATIHPHHLVSGWMHWLLGAVLVGAAGIWWQLRRRNDDDPT